MTWQRLQPIRDAIQAPLFLQGNLGATSEGRIHVMAIISFEKIAGNNDIEEVPDGYRDLNWKNFFAVDDEYLEGLIGNTNAIRSGEAAAFYGGRQSAGPASF